MKQTTFKKLLARVIQNSLIKISTNDFEKMGYRMPFLTLLKIQTGNFPASQLKKDNYLPANEYRGNNTSRCFHFLKIPSTHSFQFKILI